MNLKIKFVDFWPGFDVRQNIFVDILSAEYNVVISDHPDYLIYSVFGFKNLEYESCVRIFYTGESFTPDFNMCDYAIGFDILDFGDRYIRIPLYMLYGIEKLAVAKQIEPELVLNRKFCSFVVSNPGSPMRNRFFKLLSEYKQVDSGGRYENNIDGPVNDKISFISNYKFNIAFENCCYDGYTTEKLIEPMFVNTLPIYWGNRKVENDFNLKSFINASDYPSLEALVARIVELDKNDEEYLAVLLEPWLKNHNSLNWKERLLAFFANIFNKPLEEQKYLTSFGYSQNYRDEMKLMFRLMSNKMIYRKQREKWNPLNWFK